MVGIQFRHLLIVITAERALRGEAVHAGASDLTPVFLRGAASMHPLAFAAGRRHIARFALCSVAAAVILALEITAVKRRPAARRRARLTLTAAAVVRRMRTMRSLTAWPAFGRRLISGAGRS